MTFLTRLPTATFDGSTRSRHEDVMSLFPAVLPGSEDRRRSANGILFGVHGETVVVRSSVRPTRDVPGLVTTAEGRTPGAGRRVHFTVTLNAVRRRKSGGVTPVDDVGSWFAEKAAGALASVDIARHTLEQTHSGRSNLKIDTLTGTATVTDPEALSHLLRHGIGRAKSYGAGLLLVKAA